MKKLQGVIKVLLVYKVLMVASDTIELKSDISDRICSEPYGCFDNSFPWSQRSVALLPQPANELNVFFNMFTKHEVHSPKMLNLSIPETINEAHINPDGPIYVISHGYLESGVEQWVGDMVEQLLTTKHSKTATVIVIDWSEAAKPPYSQATANLRLVGTMTAHLIAKIKKVHHLPNLDQVHLIGHSLGSHVVAVAGKVLKKQFHSEVGRISGLDPAGPQFDNMDPSMRLYRTDAKYVDAIHTDAYSLGTVNVSGHVDFYPNGGSVQPGCPKSSVSSNVDPLLPLLAPALTCSHARSHDYFTESIGTACDFISISCSDYESFKLGECTKCGVDNHHCIPFGFHSFEAYQKLVKNGLVNPDESLKTYLYTNDDKPFCQVHYTITVKISNSEGSKNQKTEYGRLWVKVRSMYQSATRKMYLTDMPRSYDPSSMHFAFVPGRNVGLPKEAVVGFIHQPSKLNLLPGIFKHTSKMYIDWIKIDSLDYNTTIRLCPSLTDPVILGPTPSVFKEEYCL